MEICIFYSWQSKYRENCDKIIGKALNDAIKEINKEQDDYHYYIERGGGDVLYRRYAHQEDLGSDADTAGHREVALAPCQGQDG